MITRSFILAGKAIFTVEPPAEFVRDHAKAQQLPSGVSVAGCRSHYTYQIENVPDGNPDFRFVNLLKGPDNDSDYFYLARLTVKDGFLLPSRKVQHIEKTWGFRIVASTLAAIWENRQADIERAGWKVHHAGRCGRCGRTLTTPESVESGFGPECRELINV